MNKTKQHATVARTSSIYHLICFYYSCNLVSQISLLHSSSTDSVSSYDANLTTHILVYFCFSYAINNNYSNIWLEENLSTENTISYWSNSRYCIIKRRYLCFICSKDILQKDAGYPFCLITFKGLQNLIECRLI